MEDLSRTFLKLVWIKVKDNQDPWTGWANLIHRPTGIPIALIPPNIAKDLAWLADENNK